MIVHINGWPGVGKLTVGRRVAGRLGARLVDNHTLLNPALAVSEHGSPAFGELSARVRALVYAEIERAPRSERFVLTDALEEGNPGSDRVLARLAEIAARRQAPLLAVSLECALEENVRRLLAPERAAARKLTDPDILRNAWRALTLLRPALPHRLDLDTTERDAEAVADEIVRAAERLLAGDPGILPQQS
jgi:hypothetical protein